MASSSSTNVNESNINPTILLIRGRVKTVFPDIKIPPEFISWHLLQSKSVETICEDLISEILRFGNVQNPNEIDENLKSLFDVFNSIPNDEVRSVYQRLKDKTNPNWYDDVVNELLRYQSKPKNKRIFGEIEKSSEKIFERIIAVLPDIDPDFAHATVLGNESNDFELILNNFIEKGYPKLTDTIRQTHHERLKENLRNPKFEIDEFLRTFPDPLSYFYDQTRKSSENYKKHCFIYLANAFARLSTECIQQVLNENNYRFAPALDQLQRGFTNYHRIRRRCPPKDAVSKYYLDRARAPLKIPDVPDEIFYKELCFTKHEEEIIEYLSEKRSIRDEQIRLAKVNQTLQTCECCADDQLLTIDFVSCDRQHRFCENCVKNYIENAFNNDSQVFFTCLYPDCKYEYPTQLVGQLLSPIVFSRLLIRIQQEELRLANVQNFEQCKFCTFGTIIDNPQERIFRCLNPECLKETCRLCGEQNHIPLRCEEIEKRDELAMRTFIENHVTESMIRVCYQCKRRFYKTEGCNKMTCTCGASMCYVCREPITGYEHFNDNKKCGETNDVMKLHREEMKQAYEQAKKVYIERHPETRDLVLKYDPQQHISDIKDNKGDRKRRRR